MNETSNAHTPDSLDQCIEQYLGLESMEVTELLLDLCGTTIDARALPLLKQRLQEEQALIPQLQTRGYVRMSEKSEQLVAALKLLVAAFEAIEQDVREEEK
jgi:hypothetical protein